MTGIALFALIAAFGLAPQWTASSDRLDPRVILEGSWRSCVDEFGERIERVYSHLGDPAFELHMGPADEFALFKGVRDDHIDHASRLNLLGPGYHAGSVDAAMHTRQWAAMGLWLSVAVAGGSADACAGGSDYPRYSYFVLLRDERGRAAR